MNYLDFTTEDFILDSFFIKWVKEPDSISISFWESWLAAHPEKQNDIAQAKSFIRHLQFRQDKLAPIELAAMWGQIQSQRQVPDVKQNEFNRRQTRIYLPAAAVALLLTLGWLTYLINRPPEMVQVQTAFGQTKSVTLPDGSVVEINANSNLTYAQKWKSKEAREVWLDGEAYFKVAKKKDSRFITHTTKLDVEVTGTAYSVNTRRQATRVVLTEGRIQLANNAFPADTSRTRLIPGEMAEILAGENIIRKRKVTTALYASWQNNKYLFYRTPLSEIAQMLEDNFGYSVKFKDQALGKRELTGELPSINLQILLTAISESMDIKVTKTGNTVFLESNTAQ